MSLPPFLIAEVRLAFQSCARQHNSHRQFSISRSICLQPTATRNRNKPQNRPPPKKPATPSKQVESPSIKPAAPQTQVETPLQLDKSIRSTETPPKSTDQPSKELIPADSKNRQLDSDRRVPVPQKVIPKADLLSPKLNLSPKERLHLEILTRRAPQAPRLHDQKKTYQERLLIYHQGFLRENFLAVLKVSTLAVASLVTFVVVPAHYVAGNTPLWLVAFFFVGGFIPAVFVNYLTRPWVSRVWLHLPPQARESPAKAMEYARNLPPNATLDMSFMRMTSLQGNVSAQLVDLQPVTRSSRGIERFFKPLTFKWKGHRSDPGSFWMPNPLEFWVRPQTAAGKAERYTIPGIWKNVYKRLAGVEAENVNRWSK